MAAPAALAPLLKAALKKIAIAAATDKKVGKAVLGIIGAVIFILITPVLALLAIFQSGAQMDLAAMMAQAQHEHTSYRLAYFEQVMLSIEDEIIAQDLQIDPLRAQIIYLCALQGREREDDFYTNYITLFAGEQDIFEAISEAFGVAFTANDIEKIEQLIGLAQQSQTGPANNIHARILELTANDDTPLPEGPFQSPLRVERWQSLITSGFGMRIHPISGERRFHSGMDLSSAEGTPIYPAQAGTVLIVGNCSSYGLYVIVFHGGGMATLYAHCSRILVAEGQEVTTETVIAMVGDTGVSTAPHLHFEVIDQGRLVNPRNYLR